MPELSALLLACSLPQQRASKGGRIYLLLPLGIEGLKTPEWIAGPYACCGTRTIWLGESQMILSDQGSCWARLDRSRCWQHTYFAKNMDNKQSRLQKDGGSGVTSYDVSVSWVTLVGRCAPLSLYW